MFLFLTFKNALEHCPLEYIFRLDGHGVSETLMPDIPRLVIFGVVTTAYPRESRGGKRGGDVLAPAGHDGRERHLSLPVADEVAAVGEDGELSPSSPLLTCFCHSLLPSDGSEVTVMPGGATQSHSDPRCDTRS